MVLLPHLFHPETGDLVRSLWKMTVSGRQRLPEASQTQEARTTTPRILSSRTRACVVSGEVGGAKVYLVVGSRAGPLLSRSLLWEL